jgi:iron complex transport system substrate-binding protein
MRYWIFIALLWVSCHSKFNADSTYSPISNQYAQLFSLRSNGKDTVLYIYQPSDTILIKKKNNATFLLGSTTQWGYFNRLMKWQSIKGMTFPHQIADANFKVNYLFGEHPVKDIMFDQTSLDWEWIQLHATDYFLYSPFESSPCERLSNTSMLCVPFCDYQESHPLGKLEWIKVIGFLTGQYSIANSMYNGEVLRYQSITKAAKKETVLIGSFDGTQFWINAKSSHIHQLIESSGHQSVLSENNGNLPLDREQLWSLLPNVQHIILIGTDAQLAFARQQLTEWKARFGSNGYYINTDQSGYFEKSSLDPSKLLESLSTLPHPKAGYIEKITF